jgi:hypothetical protein
MLIGAAAGAACGFTLHYLIVRPTAADEPQLTVVFAATMAILGAVAAGFLSRTGWVMLAGGIIGAIAAGLFGVAATLHPKGLIYSFLGVPVGVVFALVYRLGHEATKQPEEARAWQGPPDVRDRESD